MLKELKNKKVKLELYNGRYIIGILESFDNDFLKINPTLADGSKSVSEMIRIATITSIREWVNK